MESTLKAGKKTFFCISSFQALAMFRRSLFYSYLSIYLRHFLGLSVTETTLFATLPMVLNILFQTFIWGVISDRYQKRRTLIILGELFAAISTFIVWLLHTIPDVEVKLNDSNEMFYSSDLGRTKELFTKYSIEYIWIDKRMKNEVWERPEQGLLFLFRNSETFKKLYDKNGIEVWQVLK